METGWEILRDQLFFRKELRERVYWFIHLRWAALALGGAGLLAAWAGGLGGPWPWLGSALALLALGNLGFWLAGRKLRGLEMAQARPFALFAHAQICFDLLALGLLALPTGGLSSPLAIFFIFHVVLAGVLLSPLSAFVYAALISAGLGFMGAWQHGLLGMAWPTGFGGQGFSRLGGLGEAGMFLACFAAGLFIAAYLVGSVKVALRHKGRELMRVSRQLESSLAKLSSLYGMIQELGANQTLRGMLDCATANAARLMGVKACSIKLLEPGERCLRFASTHGLSEDYLAKDCVSVGASPINRRVVEEMSPFSIGHIQEGDAFQYPEDVRREGISSMLCLPLKVDSRVLGVFCVYSGKEHFFQETDVEFFSLMSGLTALALERQQREEAKTWFLNKAAHQLRSPLGAVQSMLATLAGGYLGPLAQEQKETLERCRQRLDLLLEVVGDLLKLAAGRTGFSQAPRLEVDLGTTLTRLAAAHREQARVKGVFLELRLEPGLPPVLGSPVLLDDVLGNLLGNALKYTPAGGKVCLRLSRGAPGWLSLEVEDTGIGIPPESLARLGQEFHRAANARELGIEGTGLGLTIVRKALQRLGGSLQARSQVGRGSVFTCLLPAAEAMPPQGSG